MILSIITFILVLGLLVFIHELGHYLAAKWSGMRIDEFSIGFPPRIFSIKKGETDYSIGAIPFGGYVKIHGESAEGRIEDVDKPDKTDRDPRSFGNAPVWKRIIVLFAGVGMNVLFSFLALTIALSFGFYSISQDLENVKGAVVTKGQVLVIGTLKNGPAQKAGIQEGDLIKTLTEPNSKESIIITSLTQLQEFGVKQQQAGATHLIVDLERNGANINLDIPINPLGQPALGVEIQSLNRVRVPFYIAPVVAVKDMGVVFEMTGSALKDFGTKLFTKGKLDENVSGPIGVYKATSTATKQGFASVFFLTIMLSLNLALLNILPIPALDGGKLVFLFTELIFRKRVIAEKIENALTIGGLAFLMGLMVILTVKDLIHK